MFCLEIPMDPVAKGRPRVSTRGGFARTYTPTKTRDAESEIQMHLRKAWNAPPLTGPIEAAIHFFVPIPASFSKKKKLAMDGQPVLKRPDLDNYAKLVLDAANGILFIDDAQVWLLELHKNYAFEGKIVISMDYEGCG